MENVNVWLVSSQLILGVFLAAATGYSTWLPMLIINVFCHVGWIKLNSSFDWLGSDTMLIILVVAAMLDILSEYVPVLDNLLHSTLAPVCKFTAGAVLAAGVIQGLHPIPAAILGLVAGGTVASVIGWKKSVIRKASTVTTGGTANPVINTIEHSLSGVSATVAAAVAALLPPPVTVIVLIVGGVTMVAAFGYLGYKLIRRFLGWVSNRSSLKGGAVE